VSAQKLTVVYFGLSLRDFIFLIHIFRTVLELGSVCCISTGDITSGIKESGIKDDAPRLITLLHLTLDPTDEISGPSACHLEYIMSFKVY